MSKTPIEDYHAKAKFAAWHLEEYWENGCEFPEDTLAACEDAMNAATAAKLPGELIALWENECADMTTETEGRNTGV